MSGINRIKRSCLDNPALHFHVHPAPRETAVMHRALCISEILHEILLYASQQCIRDVTSHICAWHAFGDELSHCSTSCAYDIEMQRKRPTPRHTSLLAAALSCKTFSGVALDLLWRVLDSPEPLRHLLKCYDISVSVYLWVPCIVLSALAGCGGECAQDVHSLSGIRQSCQGHTLRPRPIRLQLQG
ncbi:hypothetical protein DAEQUDRAFT_147507 [Daedalea quercina L-15889]|uniref:Uncharacterized protein n=1 Tax=Daedalea quercina L-15889 TaxID=1314783 RepID=A0A165KN13_9APHY|nr:hypothetical protein DAEQUDRAFT_147507 [Daedalea quercina L-15889]